MTTRDTVIAYLRAVEAMDLDAVTALLHPDVEVVEHPNRLNPAGQRYDFAAVQAAGQLGKVVMMSQRYDIRALIVDGNHAAAQIAWSGVLSPGAMSSGGEMHAQICTIIEIRDGRVWRQEQYDCFAAS
jgi:ketosteroid isomerase-like protein